MAEHGGVLGTPRRYWIYTVTDRNGRPVQMSSESPPQPSGGFLGFGASTPDSVEHTETKYEDGTVVDSYRGADGQTTEHVTTDSAQATKYAREHPQSASSATAQQRADAATARAQASQTSAAAATTRAEAAATGAQTAQTRAQTGQERAATTRAYDEARAAYLRGELNRQNLQAQAQAYNQRLQQLVALGQLSQTEATNQLNQWKAGVEAAQNERRIALEQQNAATSAGQLGVSRGTLGVSQQNADTQRESVIQTASNNAVDQTIRLMSQYMKVGPGFGSQFAAGVNTLSRGGGPMNVTPDAFMGAYVPDLNAIRTAAVNDALSRLKGGMAPATQAAISQTAVPGPVTPTAVGGPPAATPAVTSGQIQAMAGPAPVMPGTGAAVPPPPAASTPNTMPSYTGPTSNEPY